VTAPSVTVWSLGTAVTCACWGDEAPRLASVPAERLDGPRCLEGDGEGWEWSSMHAATAIRIR
jgi:hypothetical protein